ncbi:hypothetical protein [Clostridium sp.]|uniref:hypothetical protein n=1 Tax=Clostridium sp. TaxID=1506 RepID=UPI003D6CF834
MLKIKNSTKTKRSTSKLVLLFIIFELIFTLSTGPYIVYYGPFKNVKTTVVGAAMTTSTLYYNDEIINNPSDSLGERSICSIIYVESK